MAIQRADTDFPSPLSSFQVGVWTCRVSGLTRYKMEKKQLVLPLL